jgi:hypothetical protein
MMRYWIGTALLAGSWMLGVGYFYPASPLAWLAMVLVAIVLLGQSKPPEASQRHRRLEAIALVLFLPSVWFASWPYQAAPLLMVLGLGIWLLPVRKRWADWLASGAVAAGVVMLVQSLVLEVYASCTAHSHDLPWPLPDLLTGVATLLGIDATADGSSIVMHSMRQMHRFAATWELLLDPVTLLFFVGGLTMLAIRRQGQDHDLNYTRRGWIADLLRLVLVMVVWLPVRAGLMMAVYLHRVLCSDASLPLHAMNHCFSTWVLLLLLIVPALLAWRFVRGWRRRGVASTQCESKSDRLAAASTRRGTQLGTEVPSPTGIVHHSSFITHHSLAIAAVLAALAVALFTAAVFWCPCGARKGGRVMVVERHSKWEPTTKPYDTKWFVKPELFPDVNSGYNYARVYRYLGQYYEMSQLLEKDKIDDETLAKCDVLIVKTPTERYSQDEVNAVVRFVEKGGGLLVIGDHTNYDRSTTIMNDMIRPMGFIFRDDLLFGFDKTPYEQFNPRPLAPHPIVQRVPPMDFAVSCSIDPGSSQGRPVIENVGLWSMGPEYHYSNYHPQPQHCPAMRYGAFVQTWAAQYKEGRAVAFADSTIFSNFAIGQPGKSELMLGMVEWLNRANAWIDPRPWLALLGLAPLAAALWIVWRGCRSSGETRQEGSSLPAVGLVLLGAGTFGWAVASLVVIGVHYWEMPALERLRPERRVVIDRTTSSVLLSNGAYTQGKGEGYGLLEQWLARLDCNTIRQEGVEAFSGDVLVAICPSRSVTEDFRRRLERYVDEGGKLLVIDSPENAGSTANSLLWPFGLSIRHDRLSKGTLTTAVKLPTVEVTGACEVAGGQPIVRIDQRPVAAFVRHGKGSVMAIGFGSVWNDIRMGTTNSPSAWMFEPDATVKGRFDLLFGLAGPFFDGKPWPALRSATEKSGGGKDAGPKESGPAEL